MDLRGGLIMYCQYLSQHFMEPKDLSDEDPETNVDAGNETQETSQVFRGDLTEVHRDNTERDTC